MQEKIKICLIIPSLRNGGSERVMSELANSWCKKEELDVFLVLLTNQDLFYKLDSSVTLIAPSRNYRKNVISKTIYKLWTFYYIRFTCKKIKPDTILSFNERYNNIVLLSLLRLRFNKYVSDRNNPYMNIGKIHNFLRNTLYKNITGIIAQTETAKGVLGKNTKNKNIKVIPNPLREIEEKQKLSSSTDKKVILNVGRNVPQKNQLELVEIFSKCDYRNWELKILGNGELRENLLLRVKELGIEDHVQILRFNKDIDAFYSEASIFAFTSLYEGFPNALNEAMAHGLPCISYDCPTGPKDIIEDGSNGALVSLGNASEFQNKLSELMESESLRRIYSRESKKVKELYSADKIANKYLNFILKNEVDY